MPYIPKLDREIALTRPQTAGELNFAITSLFIAYIQTKGLSYQVISDISGAATEALAEFRRRIVVRYENDKIEENGDVYPWVM